MAHEPPDDAEPSDVLPEAYKLGYAVDRSFFAEVARDEKLTSAAKQMRAIASLSAFDPAFKFPMTSAADQLQSVVRNSIGEQMRQIEQAIQPLRSVQLSIGLLAQSAAESPLRQFLEEQAERHRRMQDLISPAWAQTLIGTALLGTSRAALPALAFDHEQLVRMQDAIRGPTAAIQQIGAAISNLFPQLPDVNRFFTEYPARVKENVVALAEAEWYLDPDMAVADIVNFKEDLENENAETVIADLAEYFSSALDRIEAALCLNHPTRAHLLKDAFFAHRQGMYSLSIPVLFAQADGICFDLTGYYIFSRKGLGRIAKRLDPSTLERAYLEPLLRDIPVNDSSNHRRVESRKLNRHAVMHGECTDFPSEVNSLKAISFINFVSHVAAMAMARIKEDSARVESDETHRLQ
jgi:hypothetical protein